MSKVDSTRVKSLLTFDEQSGVFHWKVPRKGTRIDKKAGCVGSDGYWKIKIDGADYKAHRLAWLYLYGCWPTDQIDHINGIKTDNRISNLRLVTPNQNQQNRKPKKGGTGIKGVWRSKNRFIAQIAVNGKSIYLGSFKTKEEAGSAYAKAAKKLHTHNPASQL
jgi:HNH endonuclease/AP2 domain